MTASSAVPVDRVHRFAEYYRQHGFPVQIVNDTLWLEENRMIFSLEPVCESHVVTPSEAKLLLANSSKAILVKCTDGFNAEATPSNWYAVICRSFVDLDQYNAKKRSQVRRGLRECDSRKVDARSIADHGYGVYASAQARYAGTAKRRLMSPEHFRKNALQDADFGDIVDLWGVFHQGSMVGYAKVHLLGTKEASYCSMAFNPEYFKFYSAYSLIYRMNEHYLRERGFQYVNDGFRTLLHPTELQQMLMSKFGFERAYTRLYVFYSPSCSLIMKMPRRVRNVFGRLSRSFAALNALDDARYKDDD
jgi:hypothetical protein